MVRSPRSPLASNCPNFVGVGTNARNLLAVILTVPRVPLPPYDAPVPHSESIRSEQAVDA